MSSSPQSAPTRRQPFSLRAYLELLRLPNVFTAVADVMMGFLVTQRSFEPALQFGLLIGASCCLYLAGMVLNDVFDRGQDARERPGRPIPSGRVSLRSATILGTELLIVGTALGWTVAFLGDDWRPGIVATILAGCVLLYDAWLKRTPLGPLGMGACRFFNVLLGMSLAAGSLQTMHWMIAAGIGVYIVGVTWFARTEARQSSQLQLGAATIVLLCGIGLLASYPMFATPEFLLPQVVNLPSNWYMFWLILGLLIAWRCGQAVLNPVPQRVQAAVKYCILSLIVLDGAAAFGVAGMIYAVAILALLVPTVAIGQWLYST